MQIIMCDICKEKLEGCNFAQRKIEIPTMKRNAPLVTIMVEGLDHVCYFCAAELTFKAVEKWKKEYDCSAEGQRRNEAKQ
jgi:hypothetical protein